MIKVRHAHRTIETRDMMQSRGVVECAREFVGFTGRLDECQEELVELEFGSGDGGGN